jgi:hypothetical protein
VEEQLQSLTLKERICVHNLKRAWEKHHADLPFSVVMCLRFARSSPGKRTFNEKTAWKVMQEYDHHYLSLTAEVLDAQLLTKVSE